MSNKFGIDNFINKKIIYIDLDGTIFDYKKTHIEYKEKHYGIAYPQSVGGFFVDLEPYNDAVEVIRELFNDDRYYVLFLTAPSIMNPLSYTEKRLSIEKHFGLEAIMFCF